MASFLRNQMSVTPPPALHFLHVRVDQLVQPLGRSVTSMTSVNGTLVGLSAAWLSIRRAPGVPAQDSPASAHARPIKLAVSRPCLWLARLTPGSADLVWPVK